jgi:phage tail-like protein
MNAAPFLPPPPAPPHDPTSWRLDGLTGWRQASAAADIPSATRTLIESVVERGGALGLAGAPGGGRSLTESSGSFGGLRPPANVAVGANGSVWLLDRGRGQLKRFDPCECLFKPVPCFAGLGRSPRQLDAPQSIAVCGSRLYVADTGNQRVSVFGLNGFVLLEHWKTPAAAQLAGPWEPWSVVFDEQARAWVSDRVHGAVHLFRPGGAWERSWSGLGVVTWLAVDCDGRVYAVIEGVPPAVVRLDEDGLARPVPSEADRAPGVFAVLPFETGAQGEIRLGECCGPAPCVCRTAEAAPGRGVFDLEGLPLPDPPAPAAPAYVKEGLVFSEALDSELYRCTWHRVRLCGRLPAGTRLEVLTFTSEVELAPAEVQGLPDSAWETRARVSSFERCEWDGLVRSPAGRYLWLKLVLAGDGTGTPAITAIEVEFPRVSLRRYLPAVFGAEPLSADFTDRFLSVFDQTFRSVERQIDDQARLFDPGSAPAERPRGGIDFLSWLASLIGVTLDRHWPEARRRLFVKRAASLYDLRGTPYGLWRQLLLFLGLDEACCCPDDAPRDRCTPRPLNCATPAAAGCHWQPPPLILEHFKLRRWLFLGAGRLGSEAVVWGKRIVGRSPLGEGAQVGGTRLVTTPDPQRDPFHVYAHRFSVFVPACVKRSDSLRKGLENLLRAESPASASYDIRYVEPRFRIGFQSMVGLDAVIARVPQGVALGRTTLGAASVLPSSPPARAGLAVGKQARIGTTTALSGNQ